MADIGSRVVKIAGQWIGTPYRHQGSTRGVGCDCLGLVRGIWREIYGAEPELVAPYAADWAERGGQERLLEAAGRHCAVVPGFAAARPGDLLVFRFRPQFAAKHAGILVSADAFIHAYEQAAVIRSALVPAWRKRIAGIYRFPEIS
ncbi:peptidase P60 [Rhizobium sp. KAs_5_22]|uniref:NlpC/P60 family protein n=1 Tax=Ciceribacter selenitireducens TaxID=448181 RepID=UPI00048BB240|nr:NlpC/P60 family protein [Ciceribacter selenitireducens]PPJ47237.1 peptidase P60 [Rhizobium sp. KAs_5_22]